MKNKFAIAISLNVVITISEVIVGFMIGSLAVISDAVHNFFDIGSMALAWWGEKVGSKQSDLSKTYGYKRAEILIALTNSLLLLFSVGVIGFESVKRFFNPQPVEGGWMLLIATIAFIGNAIATKFLHKDSDHNLNLKAAFLHSMQDALFSLGVIIGAILILVFHIAIIDPIISIALSVFLLKEAYTLITNAVDILMESVPRGVDIGKIKTTILTLPNIEIVSDLHVWQTGSNEILLTAHIVGDIGTDQEYATTLQAVRSVLNDTFHITHSTIQLVPKAVSAGLSDECSHCN